MLSDAPETGIIAGFSLSHTGKLNASIDGNTSRDLFQLFGRELMERAKHLQKLLSPLEAAASVHGPEV